MAAHVHVLPVLPGTGWAADSRAETGHAGSGAEAARQAPSSGHLVRLHELELFVQTFPRLMWGFVVMYALLTFVTFLLFIWVAVAFSLNLHEGRSCDVPLRLWVIVDFTSTAYHALHTAILQYFFGQDLLGHRQLPWYERCHLIVVTFLEYFWLGMGLHWLRVSKTCKETSPHLYLSVNVYTIFSVALNVFILIHAIGLYTIMRVMMEHGVLRTSAAAPADTLDKLRVGEFDESDKVFQNNPECSICLATFCSSSMEIRITSCGHAFHSRCLKNWFKMGRTCPLCRQDLTKSNVYELTSTSRPEILGRTAHDEP